MTRYIKKQKKYRKKRMNVQSLKMFSRSKFSVIACLMILSFVGFYVWLITENSVKNYEIRDLQAKTEELQKENRKLEVLSAGSQSATNLNSQIQTLGMVSADKVDYITLFDKTVAKR